MLSAIWLQLALASLCLGNNDIYELQQPLGLEASEPEALYEFEQNVEVVAPKGTRVTAPLSASVGQSVGLEYTVIVRDAQTKAEVCKENLKAKVVSPGEQIFMKTSAYNLEASSFMPAVLLPTNPVYFIPWRAPTSGNSINIHMEGSGCSAYHPDDWIFDNALVINSAKVEVVTADKSTACPEPQVAPEMVKSDGKLYWSGKGWESGCKVAFRIANNLGRDASFGVVNLLLDTKNYLILEDGKRVDFVSASVPVLDQFGDKPYQIAHPVENIKQGASDALKFTDEPNTMLGKGCWKTKDGTKSGALQAVGYELSFRTYVLQDWDKESDALIQQVPLTNAMVEWAIHAEATFAKDKGWAINWSDSKLVKKPTVRSEQDWNFASYFGYIGSGKYDSGEYDADSGCYVLNKSP